MAEPIYRNKITQPVGQGAAVAGGNRAEDVRLVKQLLLIGLTRAGKLTPIIQADLTQRMTFASEFTIRGITAFQDYHFGVSNGRVDVGEITFTKLREEAWKDAGSPGPAPEGPCCIIPRDLATTWFATSARQAREKFVEHAMSFVGAVSDEVNGDRTRHGWQILQRMYEETIRGFPAGTFLSEFKTPMVIAADILWCGVFACWSLTQTLKNVGNPVRVEWVPKTKDHDMGIFAGETALPGYDVNDGARVNQGNQTAISLGDICVTSKVSVHHVIVASDPQGGAFDTIEGDMPYGTPATDPERLNPPQVKPPHWNRWKRTIGKGRKQIKDVWYYYSPFRPHSM